MGDWLPLVVGFAIIVTALAIARFAPHSAWGHELRRAYGVKPTGERGIRTRRDHLRSAGLAGAAAAVLFATALGVSTIAVQLPDDTQGNWIASTYMFVAVLLAM